MTDDIIYLSIGYFTKLFKKDYTFDFSLINNIREYISKNIDAKKSNVTYIIDFENIDFRPAQDYNTSLAKKSCFYFSFENLIKNETNSNFVFMNCDDFVGTYIVERDFVDIQNIWVLGSREQCENIRSTKLSFEVLENLFREKLYNELMIEELNLKEYNSHKFLKQKLIEYTFKKMLLQRKDGELICVNDATHENHILKSTSVHVNKYINIKPLIENPNSFSIICYLLMDRIVEKMGIPDFVVASSKNAFAFASGICYFINSDMLIINQISPITAYDNFSTIKKIDPKARYAVIEDFFCMGTETKIIKSILWSHGVNIVENVYIFPIASTDLLDLDKMPMSENKIFPLYKLNAEFEYKIFTHYSCPVCNKITCYHREKFKI